MVTFSIDDVRDTLTADITGFLSRIEETAGILATPPGDVTEPTFRLIEEAGHAVYGTSSLVRADSLAASAKLLEALAENGQRELALAAQHAERARKIAETVRQGATEMRAMLDLELEHRGDDAQWIAIEWQERANALLGAATQVEAVAKASLAPPPPDAGAFAFTEEEVVLDDAGLEPVAEEASFIFDATAEHGAVQDELRGIFQQEARECLVALQGHLEALFADVSDLLASRALERLYHTLKGAAATVGLEEVSKQAHALQDKMQGVVERGESLDRDTLEQIVADTAALLASAGLPSVTFAPRMNGARASGRTHEAAEARGDFMAEVRDAFEEASRMLADAAEPQTRAALAKVFHRIKGSALVVAEVAIGEEAARLQVLCESGGAATGELSRGLSRIASLAGVPGWAPSEDASRGERSADASVELSREADTSASERQALTPADPELWQAFTQECAELLEGLDRAALALEESDRPREDLRALLAPVHTLKGVVNTMGMTLTGKALHRLEDFVEGLCTSAVLPSMRSVASLLFHLHGEVRKNLKQAAGGTIELSLSKLEAQMARVLSGKRAKLPAGSRDSEHDSEASASGAASASAKGTAADRKFVRVGTDRLDALMNLAGELVVSRSRLLSRVDTLRLLQGEMGRGSKRLFETVERFCDEHEFSRLDGQKRVLSLAAGAEAMSVPQAANDGAWSAFGELELDRYEDVHILSRSLAELTNDVGEMYGQLSLGLASLTDDADAFGGIVSGIQSEVTRARMVPLEVLFSRLRLPIRDAAMREDKEVRVVTRGEDVQLDKTIADALFQPMLHLVRNAVAHGLERADAREALGKPRAGTIELSARQELGQIILEVKDDGAGLDLAKLRARGIAMGLLAADVPEGDPAVKQLVFAAGLSTAGVARDVAGRGLGCDVVRRAVERLNGSIRVESEAGNLTSFVLALPLTLAITKALVVEQNGRAFAVPLYFAERILDAADHEIVDSAGLRRVHLDGQWAPVQRLSSFLGQDAGASNGPIVVLRVGTERGLVQVDAVVGQEEIVVKSLGAVLTGHPLFAGVTVRGTGQMVLILDVPGLLESRAGRAERVLRHRAPAPRQEPAKAPDSAPRLAAKPVDSASSARLRVMFVDDSLSVRKVAEKALEALGVEVTTAVDGLDALEKMRDGSFNLVFTDLEMPRMHGFELIRELRFLTAYHDLPIVVVTSRSGQKHQEQARALGANEYLTKPFNTQSLGAAIEKWGRARRTETKEDGR